MKVDIGTLAPVFRLESVQGSIIDLASYRGKSNVLLWFSRGFTCPFCRAYLSQLQAGYSEFRAQQTEIIQIAPNAISQARQFFRTYPLIFPYVCDPAKQLYTVYGIEDRGPLQASQNLAVTFLHPTTIGQAPQTLRASAIDILNSSFTQRLQHHALTAVEQGLYLIDQQGILRWFKRLGALENIPKNPSLLEIISRSISAPATNPEGVNP